jgi:hypothetical protein
MQFKLPDSGRRSQAPVSGLFNASERKRLIIMGAVFVFVAGALMWNRFASSTRAPSPPQEEVRTTVVTPAVRSDAYRSLAKDATLEERSIVESEALEVALDDARKYAPVHFEPMNGVELDAKTVAELAGSSDTSRGRVLRVHGTIEQLVSYPRAAELDAHHRGRVRLGDGSAAFFAASEFGEGLELGVGDYIRVDGFFLKNYAESTPSGWVEGPLVVGPRAVRSQPVLATVTAIAPGDFAEVEDDTQEYRAVRDGVREYWQLVSYVDQLDPAQVDWNAAPMLDRALLAELVADPARFRGVPLRLPPCRVQGIWTQQQPENPARIDTLTEGWLGTAVWHDPESRVLKPVRFVSPRPNPGLVGPESITRPGSEMVAKGYFLRMVRYQSAEVGIQVAPLFVLADMEPWSPSQDFALSTVLWIVGASAVTLIFVFWFLLRRDKKKSAEFAAEMVRRRRARRVQQV